MLVPLAVLHRALLRLLQRHLQRLHPLHRRLQPLLQLRQLAPQVRIVAHQLLVHLGQLLQVVLQERDLLLLRYVPVGDVRLLTTTIRRLLRLLQPNLQVLYKQLAQIMQRLQLLKVIILLFLLLCNNIIFLLFLRDLNQRLASICWFWRSDRIF